MSLDTIVSVSIDRRTQVPTAKGFSTPCLVGYHTRWLDRRVKSYLSPEEVLADGFALTDKLYKDALALCSQPGRPAQFKIGRRATGVTQILDLTPTDLTVGRVYYFTWNGVKFSYTVQPSDTVALVCAGLFTASAAIAGGTRVNNTTKLTVTSSVAGKVNELEVSPGLELKDVSADPGVAADLTAIYQEDPDFYAFTLDSNSEAEVNAAATWANARTTLFAAMSSDADVTKSIVTTDVASDLVASSAARTFGIWRRKLGISTPAAWLGRCLAVNPGKINWAFKTLVGESVDALSGSEESAVEAKRFSHYQRTGGINITYDGKTPKTGEFVDIVIGSDWLTARVKEAAFALLANNDIVPFTEAGIEAVKSTVFATLLLGASANFPILDPGSIVVNAPKLSETTATDRANRTLPNVTFSGRFQGAFNKVVVNGSLYL